MRLYAEIAKIEPQDDGTLKVYGYASSEAIDADGEVITSDAMKAALPDYMKFGAVREMHQAIAAGTAIEAKVEDDGKTSFGAHIVDPIAVKKVNAGVYKGFSIGGKVTKRDEADKTRITGLKLIEVSLVDRPANPEAVLTCYKAESVEMTDEEAVEEIAKMLNEKKISATVLLKAGQKSILVIEPRAKIVPAVVQKGMYSLQDFVSVLSQIGWLAQDSASEAIWEGDNSPLSMQLKDWLATGVMIFENMVTEETSELLASLKAAVPSEMQKYSREMVDHVVEGYDKVSKALYSAGCRGDMVVFIDELSKGISLAKAGAKYSKETKAVLADVHKAMKDCCAKMDGMGYDKDDDKQGDDDKDKAAAIEVAKAEPAVEISKTESPDELLKGELAKRDEKIETLVKTVSTLEAQVQVLNAQPLPGKALLKAIGKGEDIVVADKDPEIKPILKADGSVDDVATLIKAAHATGGKKFNPLTSSL
jgi:hypothetical protein